VGRESATSHPSTPPVGGTVGKWGLERRGNTRRKKKEFLSLRRWLRNHVREPLPRLLIRHVHLPRSRIASMKPVNGQYHHPGANRIVVVADSAELRALFNSIPGVRALRTMSNRSGIHDSRSHQHPYCLPTSSPSVVSPIEPASIIFPHPARRVMGYSTRACRVLPGLLPCS
jgi:hypothetical protein